MRVREAQLARVTLGGLGSVQPHSANGQGLQKQNFGCQGKAKQNNPYALGMPLQGSKAQAELRIPARTGQPQGAEVARQVAHLTSPQDSTRFATKYQPVYW